MSSRRGDTQRPRRTRSRSAKRHPLVALLTAAALLASSLAGGLVGALGGAAPADAATGASCSFATAGTGKFAGTICWLDFSAYDPAAAASGQDFVFDIGGGNTLAVTLTASGGAVAPTAFPTWSGAYLGNRGFYTGVQGRPALYQSGDGTTTQLRVSGIRVTNSAGRASSGFAIVGADAESTDARESITWSSDVPIQSLTANGTDPGIGNACSGGFTGVGTTQVTCTGANSSQKTGTAILAATHPTSLTQTMVGGGRQAVAFGVLVSSVQLTKAVQGGFAGDDFEIQVSDADGTLATAETGAGGSSATTGRLPVVTGVNGSRFQFSERAVAGSLGNYDVSWRCTRSGQVDPTLPQGANVGSSATITAGIGDDVQCTITNRAKSASIGLLKHASAPTDVDGDGLTDRGDTIRYTFDVTNTGQTVLTDLQVADPKVGAVTCPPGQVAPGATITCTADAPYVITADDEQAGEVRNTATATGKPVDSAATVTSAPSSTVTPVEAEAPALALTKSVSPADADSFQPGQEVTYSFVVTNTGNVTVTDVAVTEGAFSGTGSLSALDCPADRTLAPDQSLVCTATYVLTAEDVDAGRVTNSATATGVPPSGETVETPPAEAEVPVAAAPSIALEKSASPGTVPGAGAAVTYSFVVTNTGNVSLSDVAIDEASFSGTGGMGAITCPKTSLLAGERMTCTAPYTTTAADADAGRITNSATATGVPPTGDAVRSGVADAVVTIPASPALTLAKSAAPGVYDAVGQRITYSFAVENTGNVTLHGVGITEDSFSGTGTMSAVDCPSDTLAAGDTMTCTATYEVTQADIDAGEVDNTATAHGTPPGSSTPVDSFPSDARVPSTRTPGISLVKSADLGEVVVGSEVTYSFTIRNTGNVTLGEIGVTETAFTGSGELSAVECPTTVLAPGDEVTCTATYVATQADIDRGGVDNTATSHGLPPWPADPVQSNPSDATIPAPSSPGLSLVKTADTDRATSIGQVITYRFAVTNTGNVTLHRVTIAEGSFTGHGTLGPVTCPTAPVPPAARVECTATYTVVAADLTGRPLSNTATATGTPPTGDPIGSDPSTVVVTTEKVTAPPLAGTGSAVSAGAIALGVLLVGGGAVLLVMRRRRTSR